jgi:hypothetical protein
LRGTDIVLIGCDLSSVVSFQEAVAFVSSRGDITSKPVVAFVGMKSDLAWAMPYDTVAQFCESMGLPFYPCSAKTGAGMARMIDGVIRQFLEKCDAAWHPMRDADGGGVQNGHWAVESRRRDGRSRDRGRPAPTARTKAFARLCIDVEH